MISSFLTLVLSFVQISIESEANGMKLDHYMLISMMGQQGFYPLEQFVRQNPEFTIDFQNLQYKHPFFFGMFGKIHCWNYFFSDLTLKKIKNDLTQAQQNWKQIEINRKVHIKESL